MRGEAVDRIVTNPPWSQFRAFLQHAMTHAEHVVFLVTINHLWTRARIHELRTAGFGIKGIVLVDTSANFPPMGFQIGAVHVYRGWAGSIVLSDWTAASPQHGSKVIGRRIPRSHATPENYRRSSSGHQPGLTPDVPERSTKAENDQMNAPRTPLPVLPDSSGLHASRRRQHSPLISMKTLDRIAAALDGLSKLFEADAKARAEG